MSNLIAIILYILSTIIAFAFIFGILMIKWPKTFCKDNTKTIKKIKKIGKVFLSIAVVLFIVGNIIFIIVLRGS